MSALNLTPAGSLSVSIDTETAIAARALREWLATPGGADLCAGVRSMDVGTLERLTGAVDRLKGRLDTIRRV